MTDTTALRPRIVICDPAPTDYDAMVKRLERAAVGTNALQHVAAQAIRHLSADNVRLREALFRIDREANGNRKNKAARISEIVRKALQEASNVT